MSAAVARAWLVHLYTALGLPLGLAAVTALYQGDVRAFFFLNVVAVFVDGTDGFLARRYKVKEHVPSFDGRRLDDIVDFLTFTFLPCLAIVELKMFPEGWEIAAAAPLLASGYGFCQERAKTDQSFVGFPSYWNIAVIYLYVLQLSPWINLVTIMVFSVLVFVPFHYVYPTRTKLFMMPTLIGGMVWSMMMAAITMSPSASWASSLALLSLFYPAYYLVVSFINHRQIVAQSP